MHVNDYERRGFPLRDFILKLILVIIFVFLLCWLLPKFMKPSVVNYNNKDGKACTTSTCDTTGISALTSQIFADNLERMKDAAISYYTDERLPKNVGDSDTMTLSDMIGKKLIVALIDKNNKACDVEKSYVKITKVDDEYILKVNLKDSEREDYILVHLGCYTYCEGALCQKQQGNVPVKGSASGPYVAIKGYIDHGIYYPPSKITPVVLKCQYKNGKYYDKNGRVVSKAEYEKQCITKPAKKYYCVKHDGKYYDDKGNVVSYEKYKKACEPEEHYYCVYHNGKYYDSDGKVVDKATFEKDCTIPEDKHYCVKYDGKWYDDKGNVVSYEDYKKACTQEEKHYCGKYNGKWYDDKGNVVSYEQYKKACEPEVEYLYEYKKTTAAEFSEWTAWSSWAKTNCATQEINCSNSDVNCLKKLQIYKQKQKIGEYDKTYARQRSKLVKTGSYTQKSCSKYNYVEINKTTYVTTTTTTYTATDTITSVTQHSTGGWVYNGRASYKNPPSDSAAKHYKFVGADYSNCSDTCQTLPNYYYDSYTYTGGLSSVSTTTTPGNVTSSTSTSTTSSTTTTHEASCGEIVSKTIPIYGYITVTEKATRREPLYGTVCYQSTKTRDLISGEITKYKWSTDNDMTLINNGWVKTGNKKRK
ncbi:MAG: hypothetical protein IJI58_05575 [Bacilli bacterium]|nr:hypothetical protein [Bacilli bacterium]